MRSVDHIRIKCFTTIVATLAAYAAASPIAQGQDTIQLRAAASIASPPIALGEIADLRGDYASSLATTVILDSIKDTATTCTISVAQVRAAIEKQRGVNLGRLTLSGAACVVRIGRYDARERETTGRSEAPGSESRATRTDPNTVHSLVSAKIAEIFAVDSQHLRLSFEKGDSSLLDTATAGRTVTITPQAMSDRVPLLVRVYDGERIAASGVVRVGVLIERQVASAKSRLSRGQAIDADSFTIDSRWLPPTIVPADPLLVAGAAMKGRVNQGEVIQKHDLESPIVVKKGDQLWVDCLSGSVVVQVWARAAENGRDGELVSFLSPGGKRPFKARMDGPGRAVALTQTTDASEVRDISPRR